MKLVRDCIALGDAPDSFAPDFDGRSGLMALLESELAVLVTARKGKSPASDSVSGGASGYVAVDPDGVAPPGGMDMKLDMVDVSYAAPLIDRLKLELREPDPEIRLKKPTSQIVKRSDGTLSFDYERLMRKDAPKEVSKHPKGRTLFDAKDAIVKLARDEIRADTAAAFPGNKGVRLSAEDVAGLYRGLIWGVIDDVDGKTVEFDFGPHLFWPLNVLGFSQRPTSTRHFLWSFDKYFARVSWWPALFQWGRAHEKLNRYSGTEKWALNEFAIVNGRDAAASSLEEQADIWPEMRPGRR